MAVASQNRFTGALRGMETRGREAEEDYLRSIREFNPYAAVESSARAGYETFREDLDEDIQGLRGQQVGAGRFDSTLGTRGEDRLVRGGIDRLNREIVGQSVTAAGMDLSRMGQLGDYGAGTTGRFMGHLSGERDREMMEEERKRQQKASRWGAIGSLAGKIGGAVLGPAGSKIGDRIGGWVGSKMGG